MPRQKTQDEILSEFQKIHGERYDYSRVDYRNSSTKVRVICAKHGEFNIAPSHHKKGVGCRKCSFESRKLTKQDFVSRSQVYFGNRYDYSLFDVLPHWKTCVPIRCTVHNVIFHQTAQNHMRGHTGCTMCNSSQLSGSHEKRGTLRSPSELTEEFVTRAREVHGNRYNYEQFVYSAATVKGRIICPDHGEFWQTPSNHLKGNTCPKCAIQERKSRTFKKRCEIEGVDYHKALKRRQAGLPNDKIFRKGYIRSEREVGELNVYGKRYPNLKEAVRSLSPSASIRTITRWLREGHTPEEAFARVPNPGYADGIIYLISNKANGKQYVGLTVQTLERRWKYHLEQARALSISSEQSLHAAIRKFGRHGFTFEQIDSGTTKTDLEIKERLWIKRMRTLVPNGYNISTGGVSGGSQKKPTTVDGIRFESVREASAYVSESRSISFAAAQRRLAKKRVDVRTPAKPGQSFVGSSAYKAWSRIVHSVLNPKSKDYIPGIGVHDAWRQFEQFRSDVGDPPRKGMAFTRLDKTVGFFPNNCKWMSKGDASKINAAHMKNIGRLTGRRRNKSGTS